MIQRGTLLHYCRLGRHRSSILTYSTDTYVFFTATCHTTHLNLRPPSATSEGIYGIPHRFYSPLLAPLRRCVRPLTIPVHWEPFGAVHNLQLSLSGAPNLPPGAAPCRRAAPQCARVRRARLPVNGTVAGGSTTPSGAIAGILPGRALVAAHI